MPAKQTIHHVGADDSLRRLLLLLAPSIQMTVEDCSDLGKLFEAHQPRPPECLVLDQNAATTPTRHVLPELQRNCFRMPVIVLGPASDSELGRRLLDAGTVAVVPTEDAGMVRSAILASLIMSNEYEQMRLQMQDFRRRLDGLSAKQLSVLQALIRGGSNKQIASEHGVSERTLERRRAELISSLHVHSVIEAAWWYGRASVPAPGQNFQWPPLNLDGLTVEHDGETSYSETLTSDRVNAG